MSFSSLRSGGSERLNRLHTYRLSEQYVWDIGCDHGKLGLSFVGLPGIEGIHLVDPSLQVIETLNTNLKASYISQNNIQIHHCTGQKTLIDQQHNIIFIAGMGGKEIGEIISHLLPQLDSTSRIVISPHRKILELRATLHELPLELLSEEVLFEDGQFYQILNLRMNPAGPRVSLYGEMLWQSDTGQKYKAHQINAFSVHQDLASKSYVKELQKR